MKIAFIYDLMYPYSIGGIQTRNWEVARRLVRKGHQVTLFGVKQWVGSDVTHVEGVRLRGVGKPYALYSGGRRSVAGPVVFSMRLALPLLRGQFDIINVDNFPYFPCFPAKLASFLKRSKLVITWHEVWGDYWLEYLGWKGVFGKLIERVTGTLTDNMVAVSPGTADSLSRITRGRRIQVIPNGVDCRSIQACQPSKESSDVIYCGRLTREKNVELLVRAIGIAAERTRSLRCLIVGDGAERDSLRRLSHSLNLDNNIVFKDYVPNQADLFSLMKSSRVFALPSTREGFGISLIEANACGLPAVTINHPRNEARSLITEGNGYLCEPTSQAMADAIARALNGGLGESSRACAKGYDWDAITDQLESFYAGRVS